MWCIFLFGYGLSASTLYRTEALRAIIGQSALEGNWLAPTLYGEPFLTKPPGMYTAIALTSLPFGRVTDFSARLPSAIAATVTVFAFFGLLRGILGTWGALISAALLPMSMLWLDKSPSAEIDMLLLMWVSIAQLCFFQAIERAERGEPAIGWWIVAVVAVTLGFLTKWTAPAFCYLTLIPFLAWQRRLGLLFSRGHLLGVLVGMALVGLWVAAVIAQTGPDLLIDTIRAEFLQRFQPRHGGRSYPWGETLAYPWMVLGANLPWAVLAMFTFRREVLDRWGPCGRNWILFCHCWAWPSLLFWTLPGQHAVRYSLPICPAITILGILGLFSIPRFRSGKFLLAVLLIWIAVKIVFVEWVIPQRTAHRGVRETAQQLVELVPRDETLYLDRLKDEGVMFYYGRTARRFDENRHPALPFFALLTEAEFSKYQATTNLDVIARLRDQQGAPIFLVRISAWFRSG